MHVNLSARDFVYGEILGSIILGSVPAVYIARVHGLDPMFQFIRTLNPPEYITYYLFYLIFVYFIAVKFKKRSYSKSDTVMQIKDRTCDSLTQVCLSIQGIFRSMAGCILAIVPPIVFVEPTIENIFISVISYTFAMTIIIVSSWLTFLTTQN